MTSTARPVLATANTPVQLDLPWRKQDRKIFTEARSPQPGRASRASAHVATPMSQSFPHPVQTYPTVFVRVPRTVADRYWSLPWAKVLHAAKEERDGLAVVTERPDVWRALACEGPPRIPDVAFLAEGQDNWRGRTVLYQQNW